jgi:hypothetical protein
MKAIILHVHKHKTKKKGRTLFCELIVASLYKILKSVHLFKIL